MNRRHRLGAALRSWMDRDVSTKARSRAGTRRSAPLHEALAIGLGAEGHRLRRRDPWE